MSKMVTVKIVKKKEREARNLEMSEHIIIICVKGIPITCLKEIII